MRSLSLSVGLLTLVSVVVGCKQSPVPEVPVTPKGPLVIDSGRYLDTRGELQEKRLDYTQERQPCALYNPHRNPYVGDLHVHTARSLDANIQNTQTTPAQAYAFAKGEPLGIQPFDANGRPLRTVQLDEPLDFAMVSDHAEFFGETRICRDPDYPVAYNSAECVSFRDDPKKKFVSWNLRYLGGLFQPNGALTRFDYCGDGAKDCLEQAQTVWEELILAAEVADDKSIDCEFSAFVGYEYTGAPVSFNLHRNIVFRNADVPGQPLSYMEYPRPENLWKALDETCNADSNCDVLTIPHNSNVSGDMMFRREKLAIGYSDFDEDYVRLRQRYEPLIEIFQHKGDSECDRSADELCGFEKFPFNNLISDRYAGFLSGEPTANSFVRTALKDGLALEEKYGANPFKYGLVASTDTHLGTPGLVDEKSYPGHGGAGADNSSELQQGLTDAVSFGPGGLAVLWAEENSRDYLFDAMRRKEAQGTSGPRILMRLYAGWDFEESASCAGFGFDEDALSLRYGRFVEQGDRGIPMGGDLTFSEQAFNEDGSAKAPSFAVGALRDKLATAKGLQTLQIVKGWLDASGQTHEQVYNLNAPAEVGIDVNSCQPSFPAKDALCSVWRDPDFDPQQKAFYYARVVEQPSCRWSWQQCKALFDDNPVVHFREACKDPASLPEGYRDCCLHEPIADVYPNEARKQQIGTYPVVIQERAWTSPVWYQP